MNNTTTTHVVSFHEGFVTPLKPGHNLTEALEAVSFMGTSPATYELTQTHYDRIVNTPGTHKRTRIQLEGDIDIHAALAEAETHADPARIHGYTV